MPPPHLQLTIAAETFAICRLEAGTRIPTWLSSTGFTSITWTPEETCVVCVEDQVPHEVEHQSGWRCLKVAGPLDFSMVGVLASLATALAAAQVSIFAMSTYDTDYLFVGQRDLAASVAALERAGHHVRAKPVGERTSITPPVI